MSVYPAVSRIVGDQAPILFSWPDAGATVTGTRTINGGTSEPAAGVIAFSETAGGIHFFRIAYHEQDRPATSGTVLFVLTDGATTFVLPLTVHHDSGIEAIPAAVDAVLSGTHGEGFWDMGDPEVIADAIREAVGGIQAQVLGALVVGDGEQILITQGNDYLERSGNSILLLIERAGVDFTGSTAEFAFGSTEADPLETVSASVENAAVGSCSVRIELRKAATSHASGQYRYDCRIFRPEEGQDDEVITVVDGDLVMRPAAGAVTLP